MDEKIKIVEPLTVDDEELLCSKGLLRNGSPQTIVDMMLVMSGLYFTPRSGSEHWQLCADPVISPTMSHQVTVRTSNTLRIFQKIDQEGSRDES